MHENFPDEQLLLVGMVTPWYVDIINYLVARKLLEELSRAQKAKIKSDAKYYVWDEPYIWKHCSDQMIRKCVHETRLTIFSLSVTLWHVEDTLAQNGKPLRYLRVVFIGLLC